MEIDSKRASPLTRDLPRRLKLSAREIGVALALTCAAVVQLMSAISSKGEKASSTVRTDPVALIRPAQ